MKSSLFVRAGLCALLVALAFPPLGCWPLALLAFILISVYMLRDLPRAANWREAAYFLSAYSFAVNIFGLYWVAYLFHEFGEMSWLLAGALMLLAFAILSLFSFAYGAGLFFVCRACRPRQWPLVFLAGLLLWDFLEYRFFPWSPVMAIGQNRYLMGTVGLWGTWGWRLIIFGLATLLAQLWIHKKSMATFAGQASGLLLASFALLGGTGYWNLSRLQKDFPDRQPVALLQGNVGNYQKKLTKLGVLPTVQNVFKIHQDLIDQSAILFAEKSADAGGPEPWVLWPETSFPGLPLSDGRGGDILFEWVKLTRGLHLVGAYERERSEFAGKTVDLEYNIVVLIHEARGILDHYRKQIRIPFGEYIPGDQYFPQAYDWLPVVNHFGAGEAFTPLPHPDPQGPVFIPVICYEILFHSYVKDFVRAAREAYPGRELILVNPTNDSWYGPTSEPGIHALMARWQAASLRLPLLRPTNTGFSQIVAPWGELIKTGRRDESLIVMGELPVKKLQKRFKGF